MSQAAVQNAQVTPLPRPEPERVNILGVGVMPLTLRRVVAMLDQWRTSGRRDSSSTAARSAASTSASWRQLSPGS